MNENKINQTLERSYEAFKQICKQKGLKVTTQRYTIFSALEKNRSHPSAEELYAEVSDSVPGLTLDTVYRTLNSLVECGLADRVPISGGRARFDGDVDPHHHFLCESCEKVFDLDWPEFDELSPPDDIKMIGYYRHKTVVFRGVCAKCSDSEPRC